MAWVNDDSTVLTYNPAGLVIDSKYHIWDNNAWKLMKRETTTYDAKNRPLVRLALCPDWAGAVRNFNVNNRSKRIMSKIAIPFTATLFFDCILALLSIAIYRDPPPERL